MAKITKKQVKSFLKEQFIMQLASASKKGVPHVNVLVYVIDDDMNFYFTTHKDSTKAKNLVENKKASLTVWEYPQMLIQVFASVTVIKKPDDQFKALDLIAVAMSKDDNFWAPLLQIEGDDYIIFKLTPEKITALDLSQKTIKRVTSPFTKIL